jgi:hypothetical protein
MDTQGLNLVFLFQKRNVDVAMVLSSWNWVVRNSPERPGEEALRKIIDDILKEMDEQMGFKEIPTVAPLETVQKMMSVGWVWGCTDYVANVLIIDQEQLRSYMLSHEENLRKFA